jgi:hypothetical protein
MVQRSYMDCQQYYALHQNQLFYVLEKTQFEGWLQIVLHHFGHLICNICKIIKLK